MRLGGGLGIVAAIGLAEIAFETDHRTDVTSAPYSLSWTPNQLLIAAGACLVISIVSIIFGSVMDSEF